MSDLDFIDDDEIKKSVSDNKAKTNIDEGELSLEEENNNVQNNYDDTIVPSEISGSSFGASGKSNQLYQESGIRQDGQEQKEQQQINKSASEENDKKGNKSNLTDLIGVKKNKASMLKRNLILCISVTILLSMFLVVFIKGSNKAQSKKKASEIGTASKVYVPNFDSIAQENLNSVEAGESVPDLEDDTPFVNDDQITAESINEKIRENANNVGEAPVNTNEGGGSYSGKKRPDTRANAMQKSISGIKGLTKQAGDSNMQQSQLPSKASEALAYLQNAQTNQSDLAQKILQAQGMSGMNLMNNQTQKQSEQAFYEKTFGGNNAGQFLSSLSLWQGTIVPAVLLTAIDTGLPGSIVARVTRNVYSSLDGKFLLIPQGTLLFAEYNSSVGYAQKRVQVGWTAMIRPDGFYVQLANMPAVDGQGYSGITGKINTHFWEFIKGLFLVSAISLVDTDVNKQAKNFVNPYAQDVIGDLHGAYQSISDKIIDRALNIEPSINVKSGTEINILINKTILLPPMPVPEVTHKYVRRK